MKMFASGRVTAYVIEKDGTRRKVLDGVPNAAGADTIGRICYYLAHIATSSPVTHVGATYGSTEVFTSGISNAAATAYSTTGYQWVSMGTWLNSTGASRVIASLRLLNMSGDVVLEYATLGSLSITVGIGATLEVQWTMIMRQNATGGTGMPAAQFLRLCNYFREATATDPIRRAWFYNEDGVIVNVALSDPTSGGTTTSANIVWTTEATAATGGAYLTGITLLNLGGDIPWDIQSGWTTTNPWVAGNKISVVTTLTPTWFNPLA